MIDQVINSINLDKKVSLTQPQLNAILTNMEFEVGY